MPAVPSIPSLSLLPTLSESRRRARSAVERLDHERRAAFERVTHAIDEVVAVGRNQVDAGRDAVRREIERRLRALGLVTRDDLVALEQRMARRATAATRKSAAASKAPAKRVAS